MDSILAFKRGEEARRSGKTTMNQFDWEKALELIRESGAQEARAGLSDDWEWTGGSIWTKGAPDFESYTYLASCWAIPEIQIGEGSKIPCYKEVPHEDADAQTKWPNLGAEG